MGQMIEATIETLAAVGYSRLTLMDVARRAGLSQALLNFHFETKDRLLKETLLFLAEEYRCNWVDALAAAGADPASQLDALIRADFNPTVCTPARLSAWCSFWGEAQSRPLYQEHCGTNDEQLTERTELICAQLMAAGSYEGDPVRTARVLRKTIDGVWLDLMTMRSPYDLGEAVCTVYCCAAAFFPAHFDMSGPVSRAAATSRQKGR